MSNEVTLRGIELADRGSHFYRADFQVHTPRDTQWDGARPTDRDAWADLFIAKAREKGLHAVAISDHHDFAFFPYIKRAASREKLPDGKEVPETERLIVFPAIELTLEVPCQCIMILDADFPEERLDDVLKALHFDPVDPTIDSLPQTKALPDSGDINLLQEKLNKNDWLKGRYIILPNVTPGGHKTLLRTSFHTKYSAMNSVGGYLDGPVTKLHEEKYAGEKRILDGLDKTWGCKRLALFQTSDARKADFSTLGEYATWVKWSSPSAEAIRQACLAQESRIFQTHPDLPNVWISRIVVSNSKFLGPVDENFNPQYTALIGGRGTGKSTILDYLRWALCDHRALVTEDGDVTDPHVRQGKLVEATLEPFYANVEVHCLINGIVHVVNRNAIDKKVQLKVGDGQFEDVSEAAIQSLIPIQAYSQKQLSSVAIRVDELLRFVTLPIQRKLEDIDRERQEIASRLRENYGTLQRHRTLTSDIERGNLRIRSLSEQAQSLRGSLVGISEEDRKILDVKAGYDDLNSAKSVWLQHIKSAQSNLAEVLESLDSSLEQMSMPESAPATISGEADVLLTSIRTVLIQIRTAISKVEDESSETMKDGGTIAGASQALAHKIHEYETAYRAVKERSSAHEAKLAELADLEEQQREVRELLQRQCAERDSLGKPSERHLELRAELTAARKERTNALQTACEALSSYSEGMIRASLYSNRGFKVVQDKFRALITGSSVRTTKIEAFFENLANEPDPIATWELVLEELESLCLLEPDAEIRPNQTPTLDKLGLEVADQKRLQRKLTPDGWLELSLAELSDLPEFEYRAKEGDYIPFDSASAGQQASALLGTLLSQGGAPLIIDQPEDDLDSNTVQQIVSKIWHSKGRRQLIFSSHNANLVVNGDADLVLVCSYRNAGDQSEGHVKERGAIDVAAVRDEITTVMEGGERAFLLRKEKYGF